MEEWKEYKLGEITNMKNGKKRPQNNGVFPVYGGNGIMDYSDSYNAENAIIVGRVGAYCGCVYKCESKCWVSDNAISIFAKDIADTQFLYYLMTTLDFHHHHIGGAQPLMTQDIIGDFTVSIPPLAIQHQIIQILKSLDDKIEVNKRINDNLEQQAQALFKSWFVDFEPFKDGEFVNSEFGMIPKGWRTGVLSDIIEILSGFAFKSNTFEFEGKYKLVTIKAVQDGYLELNEADGINDVPVKVPRHCFLKKKDILLSLTGNVGRCCLVNSDNLLLNQRVAKIEPKKIADWAYTYILFRLSDTKTYLETISRGTAQANLSPIETANMPILIPTREVMDAFSVCATPLVNYSMVLTIEAEKLAQQRDTLLPKLMSGELKINDLTR